MRYELRQMREQGSGVIVNSLRMGGLVAAGGMEPNRVQARGDRPHEECRARICFQGHPHQRSVPGVIDTPMVASMRAGTRSDEGS